MSSTELNRRHTCRLYNCYKITVSIYLLNSLYQLHTSMPNLVKLFIDACYIVFPYIKQFTAREWYYINPHQAYFISLRYLTLWELRSTSRSKKPKRCTKGGNLTCFILQALQLLSWPSSSDSEVRSYEGVLFLTGKISSCSSTICLWVVLQRFLLSFLSVCIMWSISFNHKDI